MTRDQMTAALKLRWQLTHESFSDDTVTAFLDALDGYSANEVNLAILKAAKTFDRINIKRIVDNAPTPTRPPTGHPINCECAGEGLLSGEEPDDHNPGETYTVWRPCLGARTRIVPNPGPEMSYHEYLALKRPPAPFDQKDHDFARNTAKALLRDPEAVPLRADNPLNVLVDQYLTELREGQP